MQNAMIQNFYGENTQSGHLDRDSLSDAGKKITILLFSLFSAF
jgi:hypothetical protein